MTATSTAVTFSAEGPRIVDADVAAFEAKLGHRLPEDYRTFLLAHNGGRPSRRTFDYDKKDLTLLNCFLGLGREDEGVGLEEPWELSREWLPPEILTIGYDDGGAQIALAVSGPHAGELWFCLNDRPTGSNPRVIWYDRRDVTKLASSFTEFLGKLQS